MATLNHNEVVTLLAGLGILLLLARALGEACRRLHQPTVLGEIAAGILLGPTVLGAISPETLKLLFPAKGSVALAHGALTNLGAVLFLLAAGMEVDLSTVGRQGRVALSVSFAGILVPFVVGYSTASLFPQWLQLREIRDPEVFALFFATALSISALPVIAKIMIDLGIYRSDMGMTVIAAAVVDDLIGWIIFAMILGTMGPVGSKAPDLTMTVTQTLLFASGMLTVGRWAIARIIPWLQAHTSWPGGVLGFALGGALLSAAMTEWIGIHAIFGAFMFGVALGDAQHLRERTRATIEQFVSFFFAPLFFGSIGLRVDFVERFDLGLVLFVLVVATLGKVLGCGYGARLAGMPPREAWAIGWAMNARGAMEIILGLLALQAGVIGQRMFVALVVMALVTSMMAGVAVQRLMGGTKVRRFVDHLAPSGFVQLASRSRRDAIRELCRAVAATGLAPELVGDVVWLREQAMGTSVERGVALPSGRIPGLKDPVVAVGISEAGIDFDSPDGEPTRVVVLVLTAAEDDGGQLQLVADISRTFENPRFVDKVVAARSRTEFLALVRTDSGPPVH